MAADPSNLIWIDLEMTGLEPQQDYIIEIATSVTNSDLKVIAEGPIMAIRQTDEVLAGMDEWNTSHHTSSGLVQRVRDSDYDEAAAEAETITFLEQYVPAGASPMCGNSICQDRRFLARWMPALEEFFHYRNLDVSSVKELAKRWHPELYAGFSKESSHLAMLDIRDSIDEMAYYRDHFLRLPG